MLLVHPAMLLAPGCHESICRICLVALAKEAEQARNIEDEVMEAVEEEVEDEDSEVGEKAVMENIMERHGIVDFSIFFNTEE